jgi:hypothetical protein
MPAIAQDEVAPHAKTSPAQPNVLATLDDNDSLFASYCLDLVRFRLGVRSTGNLPLQQQHTPVLW